MGFPANGPEMPEIPFEFTNHHIDAIYFIHEFFEHDARKTALWMNTKNPHFGNVAPKTLFFLRPDKFSQIVTNLLEGNYG